MTVAEFVHIVCAHFGGREETCPFGPTSLRLLSRIDEQGQERAVLLPDTLDDQLESTVLQSWCEQLGLPPAEFGLV